MPRKMSKLLNFMILEGWNYLNCDNTELKRSSKINVSVSERHRWAVLGKYSKSLNSHPQWLGRVGFFEKSVFKIGHTTHF